LNPRALYGGTRQTNSPRMADARYGQCANQHLEIMLHTNGRIAIGVLDVWPTILPTR